MPYRDNEKNKAAKREHYRKNKDVYAARARAREREMQIYVWTQKRVPCMDCNVQYNPWVMQFDHRPEETKSANISRLIQNGSWQKLYDEIAKCDVVCANCHILRTAARGGWIQEEKFIYEIKI